ncbi:MAG: hypothetical protein JNJ63_10805 [Hyphomonadaceae bacterium]|nr:hypothetical protein [Hyphomonadaceae bacterium]
MFRYFWSCFALAAFAAIALLRFMAPEVLACSIWLPIVASFFVVGGVFSLFSAERERDEALKGAELSRRWLEHPSYVSIQRFMGAILMILGIGLFYLMLTQLCAPASG